MITPSPPGAPFTTTQLLPSTDTMSARGERLYGLDVLRGIAAYAVLVFHYPHLLSLTHGQHTTDELPWFVGLGVIYRYGWLAVDLFFCLSGFVFFWLYARPIADGRQTSLDFAVRRFSRVYPLHIILLIFVALGQLIFFGVKHSWFVYQNNGFLAFLENISLTNGWPPVNAESFNGPSWSLSVEIFLYMLFYVLARARLISALPGAAAMIAAGLVVNHFDHALGRGVTAFYAGAVVQLIMAASPSRHYRRLGALLVVVGAFGLWVVAWFVAAGGLGHLHAPLWSPLGKRFSYITAHYTYFADLFCTLLLFPATILAVVAAERSRLVSFAKLEWLGNLSYGAYLLHFPVQLTIAVIVVLFRIDIGTTLPLWLLVIYLLVVGMLASLSFKYIETPAQNALRGALLRGKGRSPRGG